MPSTSRVFDPLEEVPDGGYTIGMKTAISIPDELFQQADDLAHRAGKSRSQVYAEALREYLARHDPEAVRIALDRVAEELGGYTGGFAEEAARRILEHTEW